MPRGGDVMEIAINDNGERISAIPNKTAKCPICNEEVISKCGNIKIWHWAHKVGEDCDSFGEPETEWHLNWKNKFPKENREVILEEGFWDKESHHWSDQNKKHRADIFINNLVIEFQNSSISSKEIKEREEFYNNMIWVLNGFNLCSGLELRKSNNNIVTFRWKNPPKSWWESNKKIYIDLNWIPLQGVIKDEISNFTSEQLKFYESFLNKIFYVKKIYPNIPCGGYGILLSKEQFLEEVKKRGWKKN